MKQARPHMRDASYSLCVSHHMIHTLNFTIKIEMWFIFFFRFSSTPLYSTLLYSTSPPPCRALRVPVGNIPVAVHRELGVPRVHRVRLQAQRLGVPRGSGADPPVRGLLLLLRHQVLLRTTTVVLACSLFLCLFFVSSLFFLFLVSCFFFLFLFF